MASNYPRQEEEDARRRQSANVERQRDQHGRQEREALENWRRTQFRQQAADDARRQQTEFERRRPS